MPTYSWGRAPGLPQLAQTEIAIVVAHGRLWGRSFGLLYVTGIDELSVMLECLLDAGQTTAEAREVTVAAQGLAKAAELLGREYTLVATNVPFLG